jgi:signal transduction histidine kinase
VWKELSFTAAHKLGNPVFALETDLQALKRRLQQDSDALLIADEMGSSLEKAKVIIEQFKSLTKAQEISPRPVQIGPLLQAACRVAKENGVQVIVEAPDVIPPVLADPNRITECFDELVANALHWFDKPERKITIVVEILKGKEIPDGLERSRGYLRIRFGDNGCGVSPDNKQKAFAPFFTTHPHGTGLGLALVERIITGHGGIIRENGRLGEGATFEIYLPAATKADSKGPRNA